MLKRIPAGRFIPVTSYEGGRFYMSLKSQEYLRGEVSSFVFHIYTYFSRVMLSFASLQLIDLWNICPFSDIEYFILSLFGPTRLSSIGGYFSRSLVPVLHGISMRNADYLKLNR